MPPLQAHTHSHISVTSKINGGSILLTDCGVLKMDLRGAVTAAVMGAALAFVRTAAQQGAKSFCLLADRALLTMGCQHMRDLAAGDTGALNGALVVSELAAQPWRDYAAGVAERGVVRLVFTDRAKALDWAAQQAQLAVEQEQWEMARHPSSGFAKSARKPGAFAGHRRFRPACGPSPAPWASRS